MTARVDGVPERFVTPRLRARRVVASDLGYVVETDSDAVMQRTLSIRPQTPEESRVRLERWLDVWHQCGYGFWIFENDAAAVGHAGIFPSPRDAGSIEVGYALKPAYWNQGYATEMASGVLEIAFSAAALERVVAIALASNAASRRVMEKLGMKFARVCAYPDGSDGVLYALTRAT
ncbi:MAG TPA: GNAT family N-acetyltransferase, partial [Candidatus Acidoferrales bacterium]|nr:GNAT family N-acetyltransferase [Candidatus Acidoferrales bacterium]